MMKKDELIREYMEIQQTKYSLKEAEDELIALIEEEAVDGVVEGDAFTLKLSERTNVTYKKERGAPSPLLALSEEFPILNSMIRVDVRESGQKIQKMLDSPPDDDTKTADLIKRINAVRQAKKGKPAITVERNE